ncbi:DUF192 domain-containing protein [Pseudothauera nasutitermitis]|uniref:DUF192 domain-containing protein n=1 Tax=Pseudothauera nasutitermitis TaxID=2565930 RepID=A0A4S4AZY8_9RHOO|nr:DUF192 domain-containing protein [Pseudothauera nasutitermitis]THF65741.1 DUF192 domain-containing protein [Pseudothauera nasutitermitis]
MQMSAVFPRSRFVSAMLCAAALWPLAASAQMPVAELGLGMYRIEAEVAHTPQTRQTGLMNRHEMPQQRGMVFVFDMAARHCMWMRNTFIPLSVAFLDEEGRILNIADMTPHSEDNHCAAAPARYALEMNQGWFAAKGIGAGARLRGLERLPAPR